MVDTKEGIVMSFQIFKQDSVINLTESTGIIQIEKSEVYSNSSVRDRALEGFTLINPNSNNGELKSIANFNNGLGCSNPLCIQSSTGSYKLFWTRPLGASDSTHGARVFLNDGSVGFDSGYNSMVRLVGAYSLPFANDSSLSHSLPQVPVGYKRCFPAAILSRILSQDSNGRNSFFRVPFIEFTNNGTTLIIRNRRNGRGSLQGLGSQCNSNPDLKLNVFDVLDL